MGYCEACPPPQLPPPPSSRHRQCHCPPLHARTHTPRPHLKSAEDKLCCAQVVCPQRVARIRAQEFLEKCGQRTVYHTGEGEPGRGGRAEWKGQRADAEVQASSTLRAFSASLWSLSYAAPKIETCVTLRAARALRGAHARTWTRTGEGGLCAHDVSCSWL